MGKAETEIKACSFLATLTAIAFTGLALINDAGISQVIGTFMVAWVCGFVLAMTGCGHE